MMANTRLICNNCAGRPTWVTNKSVDPMNHDEDCPHCGMPLEAEDISSDDVKRCSR